MVLKWDKVGKIIPRQTNMLIGEYKHTIDEKKRISLPSKFRKQVGKKIIITRGLDKCLFLYSPAQWKEISRKIGELGLGQADRRGLNRFMLAGATEVSVDSVGRILIPEYLKDFANIKTKVVFAGVYNRIEIWDEDQWNQYTDKVMKEADDMAEKLGDVGAL